MSKMQHHDDTLYRQILAVLSHCLCCGKDGTYYAFEPTGIDSDIIGEYVSALSNEARLANRKYGYLFWGIDDQTHEILGTTFDPREISIGGFAFEAWLEQLCEPRVGVSFYEFDVEGKRVVTMAVGAARLCPTRFNGKELIRNASHNEPLRDFPAKEARLWASFAATHFEEEPAMRELSEEEVTRYLDIEAFYRYSKTPMPSNRTLLLQNLCQLKVLRYNEGSYAISNVGALLFARDLNDFPTLQGKALRVVDYASDTMTSARGERVFAKGYLLCFADCEEYIVGLLPRREDYDSLHREELTLYPRRALREALGNMICHQDLGAVGYGPLIGIHPNYIEFSNPGSFEGDILRAMDMFPLPRNPVLLNLLHLTRICESRGTGIDLMEEWMGLYHEPSPILSSDTNATRLLLRHYDSFKDYSTMDAINTVYMSVCFAYISSRETSNADIRERLGIDEKNAAAVSRLLNLVIEKGLIKIADPSVGAKSRRYVPFWA